VKPNAVSFPRIGRVSLLRSRAVLWAFGIALFLALPFVIVDPYLRHLGILAMLFAVAASNWDLTLGYAGLFNFAHIAFFGLGAYTSGILAVHYGVSPWLGILGGTVVAVIVSAIISLPAIRLRGIYVALITFAFSQLTVALIVSQTTLTGGLAGLVSVPGLSIGGFAFHDNPASFFYLAGALLLASTLFLRRIVKSDLGLSLVALRDFEEYAVSRGVPIARQRFLAFVLSAIFPGMVGAVYAHYLLVVSPDVFGFSFATLFLSMVLVGGIATTYGPVLAAVLLTYVTELLAGIGTVRFMLVAVLVVVTLRFLPTGAWGLVQRRLRAKAGKANLGEGGTQGPRGV
jgi:branched-chain amino acid transport system permease protein